MQWLKEKGQTTQWLKEKGQTTQWLKEKGQTIYKIYIDSVGSTKIYYRHRYYFKALQINMS